jgi:DNA-binding PadR family transcriptional regulator
LQLRLQFEAGTGEVWPLNVGQVYTTLQRVERDGLVESDDAAADGPQKRFRITAEGQEELAGWLRTPPDLSSPPRDELVIKVLVALRVPGVDVHEVVQVHRRVSPAYPALLKGRSHKNALPFTNQVRLPWRSPSVTSGSSEAMRATSSMVAMVRTIASCRAQPRWVA